MGLDFTSIPDREGAALYVLHTGNTVDLQRLTRLTDEVAAATNHQIVLIGVNTPDGEKIRDFYDLDAGMLPIVMIVQDNDSIAMQWSGSSIPTSGSDIAYQLNRISGPSA